MVGKQWVQRSRGNVSLLQTLALYEFFCEASYKAGVFVNKEYKYCVHLSMKQGKLMNEHRDELSVKASIREEDL